MGKSQLWVRFETTGHVDDYLKYKEQTETQKDLREHPCSDAKDESGDLCVWTNNLNGNGA